LAILEERDHLEDPDMDGGITLKRILKENKMKVVSRS